MQDCPRFYPHGLSFGPVGIEPRILSADDNQQNSEAHQQQDNPAEARPQPEENEPAQWTRPPSMVIEVKIDRAARCGLTCG